MNPTAFLEKETLRPFITWVVPGAVAMAPYLMVAFHGSAQFAEAASQNAAVALLVVVLLAAGIGVVTDALGGLIERIWDSMLEARDEESHKSNWEAYLQLPPEPGTIAEEYVSYLVLMLKTELALPIAVALGWPGLWLYRCRACVWQGDGFWGVTALLVAVSCLLLFESYKTAENLATNRQLILKAHGATAP